MSTTRHMNAQEKREWAAYLEQKKFISSAIAPPADESPAKQRARIKRSLKTLSSFAKEYFSAFMDADFAWFHRSFFRVIEQKDDAFIVCEWPREHGKSVIVDVLVPLYLLAKGKLTGMILASSTEQKAKGLLKDIQAQLESNRRFIHDFGEQRPMGAWADGHFTTVGGVGFWAFGLGQNPAGVREAEKRPNYGVIDDADDKRKAKNQQRVQEDVDWILGEFLGCLSIRGSHMVFANNRVHRAGLTAHIVGDVNPGDPKRKGIAHIKAYATENPKTHAKLMPDAGGVPSWKERYTIEHIRDRMDRMGHRNAMRQFYHEHQEEGHIFTPAMIQWVKPLKYRAYDRLISYLDPSWKSRDQNDYKAIVLLGKTGPHFHVLWAWVRQAKVSDMVNAHYLLDEMIGDVACQHWMEAGLMQDQHMDHYRERAQQTGDSIRLRLDTRKKPDKVDRIANLEPLMQLGLLRFSEAMRQDADMQRLVEQFLAFPYGADDGPDAVEGAVYLMKGKSRKSKFVPRMGTYKTNQSRRA